VKHGDGVFFGAGRGAGSVPPAPAEALKATAAAATVTEVGCGALPEGVVDTEDGAVRSAVWVGSPDAPSGCAVDNEKMRRVSLEVYRGEGLDGSPDRGLGKDYIGA
jgi:hypothetical protein